MDDLYTLRRGESPLIISIPHLGTRIPQALRHLYTDYALMVADTDWHLDRLYGFALELGATILGATFSRYVVDLNRPSSDESLYPGQVTTGLCPTETFRGEPIYKDGCEPTATQKQDRVSMYWTPYHDALRNELVRLRAMHPNVLLWEAHSIAGVLPRLFADKLPDLNIGTQDGKTADPTVQVAAMYGAATSNYSWVANGRFKGGFITRHFGAPHNGVHALQLEMCQSTYMDEEPPFEYSLERSSAIEPTLRRMVEGSLGAVRALESK